MQAVAVLLKDGDGGVLQVGGTSALYGECCAIESLGGEPEMVDVGAENEVEGSLAQEGCPCVSARLVVVSVSKDGDMADQYAPLGFFEFFALEFL